MICTFTKPRAFNLKTKNQPILLVHKEMIWSSTNVFLINQIELLWITELILCRTNNSKCSSCCIFPEQDKKLQKLQLLCLSTPKLPLLNLTEHNIWLYSEDQDLECMIQQCIKYMFFFIQNQICYV